LAEVANILWKKVGRGELTAVQAEKIAQDVSQADINVHPLAPLFEDGLRIALATGRSAYDSIYLALADSLSTRAVTADRRLYNALQGGPFAHLLLWVEDGP
jgi:predicted nucleic acid-binding protein